MLPVRITLALSTLLAGCSAATATSDAATSLDAGAGSGADLAGSVGPDLASNDAGTASPNALWIPPLLTGTSFDLKLADSSKQLRPGAVTATYGYNDLDFWGPTLVMNKGDKVQLNVRNTLAEETTVHWHGFHIPAAMDGGPHQMVDAGATWSPSFEVKNNAGTFWYHPHLHTTTQKQLTRGAGGFIIVRDPEEAALALPRTYGVDDVPLVLTSRRFLNDNQFDLTSAYGDYLLTNGVMKAEASFPAQLVRLRILNAEIERGYVLGFSDNRTFNVIATDGGLVNAPIPVTRVKLYPGERVEIVVDLTAAAVGSAVSLQAFNGGQAFGFPGGEPAQQGNFGSLLNDKTFDVLKITASAATAGAIKSLPAKLASHTYWTDADATTSRTISITDMGPGTPFTFGGLGYDPNRIDQTVALGATEKWTIKNNQTFDHSFHIHDVEFKLVARNGGAIEAYEQGWKDTVSVPRNGSISFVARFADFASPTNPYMYHCHMSNHEDEGLMGQFLVK